MDLLRFTTSGNVDDGKSTLIGRLLYDTRNVPEEQLADLQRNADQQGTHPLELSRLTDGLRAERAQGITIDVAYRYFATPRRQFIIADSPGHLQYTRNLVTAASTASLALVLVDAHRGLSLQTRRHALIASLLHLPHLIVCVNKMDLVGWSQARFGELVAEFSAFASRLDIPDIRFLPLCALQGDNVVSASPRLAWHQGGSLLHELETTYLGGDSNHIDARLPIQTVLGGPAGPRRLAGRVASGVFKPGDRVVHLPSGRASTIRALTALGRDVAEAFSPMAVELSLADDLAAVRGDLIAKPHNQPRAGGEFEAMVCWLADRPLDPAGRYRVRHLAAETACQVRAVRYKIDIHTLHRHEGDRVLGPNEAGRVAFSTAQPLLHEPYSRNRTTGSFILVDASTHATVAAGMIL